MSHNVNAQLCRGHTNADWNILSEMTSPAAQNRGFKVEKMVNIEPRKGQVHLNLEEVKKGGGHQGGLFAQKTNSSVVPFFAQLFLSCQLFLGRNVDFWDNLAFFLFLKEICG